MLAFLIVVVVQLFKSKIDFGGILKGFFAFQIPDRPGATTTILGAIGAAVGINMTFLYPYSILAKGWGSHHKGLARFDLVMSLVVPYVILTSLIIIGMAATVHTPPYGTGLGAGVTAANFKPIDAAQSLATVLGGPVGRIVFDLGFMGMACGAISAHMVCCGFTVCEMFGLEYTPQRYRLFTLVPAIGVLGVMIKSPIWLPVLASAIAFTMLPIAYISFFILNNKKSYLGEAVGRGVRRWAFNVVLAVAVAMSVVGSAIQIKAKVIDRVLPAKKSTGSESEQEAQAEQPAGQPGTP
jgi:Mn2+/Fe2+ NRAMP family transporter